MQSHALNSTSAPLETMTIGSKLGSGTVGNVYLGTWNDTQVAIKIISDTRITSFNNEVRMLSYLQSIHAPNVVNFFGSTSTTSHIILMEYTPNGNLEVLLRSRKPLAWEIRYKFMQEIAIAVRFLHDNQIIHRDIKTRNLLLTADLHVKLCDFDTAMIVGEQNFEHAGTLDYMAPETMNFWTYSFKTDIYSVGITFWEIMTRKEAFSDINEFNNILLRKISDNPLEIPPNSGSPRIAHLVQWCIKPKPQDRPCAAHVKDEIDRASTAVTHSYNLRPRC